jgi:hypothetical protein
MSITLPEATQRSYFTILYNQLRNMAAMRVRNFGEGAWPLKKTQMMIVYFLTEEAITVQT